jgi:ATP/maltotriose-dependent transcriptional regulator MalT/DNA-binding SARP family transcriptional activator
MGTRSKTPQHAITAPDFTRTKAHRPRLVDDLLRQTHKRLVLVCAPAGYGKTTFLADVDQHAGQPVCWVRLTEADRDPMRLASLVWASLCRRFRRLRKELRLEQHAGAMPEALGRLIGEAVERRVPEAFFLVFDDVQLLADEDEPLVVLDNLLEALPATARVVVAGREVPDLPLVKWIADDKLRSYGPEDLSLDLDELQAVFEARGRARLEQGRAIDLLESTGGWITGVLLSDVFVGEDLPALAEGGEPLAYEYLADAAFERQPEDVREFLLRSSALPLMTGAACDQVLGRKGSQRMLTRLVRSGLFISVTGDRPKTYEYHHLFRAFLQDRFRQAEPEEHRALQLKAAAHYAGHDQPELAFDLYMEAGDVHGAVEVAEANARSIYERGNDHTILDWATRLWTAGCQATKIYSQAAYSAVNGGSLDEALRWCDRLEEGARRIEDGELLALSLLSRVESLMEFDVLEGRDNDLEKLEALEPYMGSRDRCRMFQVRSSLALADRDFTSALSYAREGFEYAVETRQIDLQSRLLATQSVLFGYFGDVGKGVSASFDALELTRKAGYARRLPLAYNNAGVAAHVTGDLESADRLLRQAIDSSNLFWNIPMQVATLISWGDLLKDCGAYRLAADVFLRAQEKRTQSKSAMWDSYLAAQSAAIHRHQRDFLGAERVASGGGLGFNATEWSNIRRIEHLAARLLLGDTNAEQELESIEQRADLHSFELTLARVVLALGNMNSPRKAQGWVRQCINYAEAKGTLHIVAAELRAFPELLPIAKAADVEVSTTNRIEDWVENLEAFRASLESSDSLGVRESKLELVTFGKAELSRGGSSTIRLRPQHLEILVFLADSGQASSERLADVFWPHLDPSGRAACTHTAIYEIRKAVDEEIVVSSPTGYRFCKPDDMRIDLLEFKEVTEIAVRSEPSRPELGKVLEQALDLYGGSFLEGVQSDWASIRRREIESLHAMMARRYALHALASHLERSPRLDLLRTAANVNPYDDEANRAYILGLARTGRRLEARQHFQRYRKRLVEDLQLEPAQVVEDATRNPTGATLA